MLALIEARRDRLDDALKFIELSLARNAGNLKARALKTVLLRITGRISEMILFATETLKIDPLNMHAEHELSIVRENDGNGSAAPILNDVDTAKAAVIGTSGSGREKADMIGESGSGSTKAAVIDENGSCSAKAAFRMDNADIIELGMLYLNAGMFDEAMRVYRKALYDEPMIDYYRYYCSNDGKYLEMAENAPSDYCFPNRTEDIMVLEYAAGAGGKMASYYLGCLLYDKGLHERAAKLWENSPDDFPTAHRNLALAYYNKQHDPDRARKEMMKAFELDKSDPRVFYELDQLFKEIGMSSGERLDNMLAHKELLECRDPLYTEYITLLNDAGRYEEAYGRIMNHHFHPWEGGEGKITAQYKRSLIKMAESENDDEKASALLKKALTYPENLAEGRLIGQLDNDVYYFLAMRTADGNARKEYLELAARGTADFSSAMYYNDQPPEMVYYMALALAELGRREEAAKIFADMRQYGETHMNDHIAIDYFAVSLPDFLIFEADLDKKNRKHCENMIKLGGEGLEKV